MEFELSWTNEITIIMILKPFYSGSGIIRMQDVWDVEHSACGKYRMWNVWGVRFLACGTIKL